MEIEILDITHEVLRVLDQALSLNGQTHFFKRETPLLGALPELDSMAVIALISGLEEQFDIVLNDDEISGQIFETVGTLSDFVALKLAH